MRQAEPRGAKHPVPGDGLVFLSYVFIIGSKSGNQSWDVAVLALQHNHKWISKRFHTMTTIVEYSGEVNSSQMPLLKVKGLKWYFLDD